MRWPVESPVVSSPFDPNRRHPVLGYVRPHNGTDFGWKSGVELFVIADGVVAGRGVWNAAKRTPEGGNWVSIDFILEGVRYRAVYLHMLSPSPLRVGQKVTEGMLAGVMGATGLVDGRHLHFEIRIMPADTPIDPELFLRGGTTAGNETPVAAPILEDDMPGPLFLSPNIIMYPNGYTTSAEPAAWTALKARHENPDSESMDWATQWAVDMAWVASNFMIARQAEATATAVRAVLQSGGITVDIDDAAITAQLKELLGATNATEIATAVANEADRRARERLAQGVG